MNKENFENQNENLPDFSDCNERLKLYEERLKLITDEKNIPDPFGDFFVKEADFLCKMISLYRLDPAKHVFDTSLLNLEKRNNDLYSELLPENYSSCFGNPDFSCQIFGDDIGRILSALYAELRGTIVYAYERRLPDLVLNIELLLECLSAFLCGVPRAKDLKNIIASYNFDYCGLFMDQNIESQLDPKHDFALRIIMDSDLSDIRYLYSYGEYVSENELKTAEFLNSFDQSKIDAMAFTFTNGYKTGFEVTGKDLSKKKTVNIRYPLGFERMVKSAVLQFKNMGLEPVIYRSAVRCINKRGIKIGYTGSSPNPQFDFDHNNDESIYLNERFVSRKLASLHNAFEKRRYLSSVHAGPALIETFGENPFVPKVKKTACSLSEKQRGLKLKYESESSRITNRYIIAKERSYTIIAYPIPEIGNNYEEIFKRTVGLNNLDYKTCQRIQQHIADALDKGRRVVVKGRGGNLTDITVALHELKNRDLQTNFENCAADVNIPAGEVFTSPLLKGTNGILHVSRAYLNGLCFKNLKIKIKDGMTSEYSCGNFSNPEDGKRYIEENILFHHKSLPVGEFAIGTNTAAYAMAREFRIEEKLPILIAEKTGPHFAFGDTCYSREEDIKTYNPDGKKIIAKENECSKLRKSDTSKAYFNCHTDITIPYEELGCIYSLDDSGNKIFIIRDGKFVLPGTEKLNIPLNRV